MPDAAVALEIVRSVTQTMQESSSSGPALEAVVKLISEKMRVDVCSIYLYRSDEACLRLAASWGLNRERLSEVSMAPEEGLTGHVFSRGEIVNIADPGQDSRNKHFPALGEDRLNNFLGIPIPPSAKWGEGVLTLQSTERQNFSPMVEDLAYTLAAQLGTLLENRSLKSAAGNASRVDAPAPKEAPPFVRAQVAVGGVADGKVIILKTQHVWDSIYFSECEDSEREAELLERALDLARRESRWLKQRAGELFAELDARIFETHEYMLGDDHYLGLIRSHVRERMTAPFAVKLATREWIKTFQDSGNPMLVGKAADLKDVALRILNALGDVQENREPFSEAEAGHVLAAMELLPSDLVYLSSRKITGILSETGGLTSHAAILARSLGIPCFIGIPGLTAYLQAGTRVIMDGNSGLLYINPDEHVQREYQRLSEARVAHVPGARRAGAITRDGVPVRLTGNLSLLSDFGLMEQYGVEGVGLYRSEFFFMIRNSFPDEETQFEVYRRVLEQSGTAGATFRLLDAGGDKPLKYFEFGKEENPNLGWRSIRMLLSRPDVLKPHLRALLRTAQAGNMRIVVPMLSLITELRALREKVEEVRRELEQEHGRPFRVPPIGAMIEIPSAVLQIDAFVRESDFISIGTNDLIQYLFAVDRGNDKVVSYYQPFHPALIQALGRVAAAARAAGKSVTVCGEMASDPQALPVLLGLGLSQLSVAPASADLLRAALGKLDAGECRALLKRIAALDTAEDVRNAIEIFLAS